MHRDSRPRSLTHRTRRRWLVALAAVPATLGVAVGCPGSGGESNGNGGASATAGAAGAAGQGDAAVWDPVWHETQPEDWEVVGPENSPDCGPGCRIALNLPTGNPIGLGHSASPEFIASGVPEGQGFAHVGESKTYIVPRGDPKFALMRQGLWNNFLSATRVYGIGRGRVEVINLVTGETKIAFEFNDGQHNASLTALGPSHVYWEYEGEGIMSRNLVTGEIRTLKPGGCWRMIGVEKGLLCEDGQIFFADPETGNVSKLDDGPAFQADLACSPDRKQCAWVDYRDPPGQSSTWEAIVAGEVYVRDMTTGATRRVTFDSPTSPLSKVYPAVAGNLVVWNEEEVVRTEPEPENVVYSMTSILARLDLTTGERCKLNPAPERYGGVKTLHDRHMYAAWRDDSMNQVRIVDLDLDHPNLTWECSLTPGWQ